MDSTLLPFALLCFTSFFTLTNPLGTMPVFLTMTHGMTDKERQSIVRRATIVSFITIMVFVFAGQFLFKFFGISLLIKGVIMIERIKIAVERIFLIYFFKSITGILRESPNGIIKIKKEIFIFHQ